MPTTASRRGKPGLHGRGLLLGKSFAGKRANESPLVLAVQGHTQGLQWARRRVRGATIPCVRRTAAESG